MKTKKIAHNLGKFIHSDFFVFGARDVYKWLLTILFSVNLVFSFSFIRAARENSNSSFEILVVFFLFSFCIYILYKIHSNWYNCCSFSAFLFAVGSLLMATGNQAGLTLCNFSGFLLAFGIALNIISLTIKEVEKKRKKK